LSPVEVRKSVYTARKAVAGESSVSRVGREKDGTERRAVRRG